MKKCHHQLTVSHITVWPEIQIIKYYINETEDCKRVCFSLTDYFKWLFDMVYNNVVTCSLRGCTSENWENGKFYKNIFVVLTVFTALSEYETILLFIISIIVLSENSFF